MDDPDTWRWIWLAAAAAFAGGEIAIAGSFFLAPFAVGATVAVVAAFAGVPIAAQWLAFLVVSGLAFAALRPLARRLDERSPNAKVGATRLAGRVAIVIDEIPTHGVGLVRIDREEWRAEAEDGHGIAEGTRVRIVETEGTRVIVTPAAKLKPRYTPPGLPLDPPRAEGDDPRPPTDDPPPSS